MNADMHAQSIKKPTLHKSSILIYFLLLLLIFLTIIFLSRQSLSSLVDSFTEISPVIFLGAIFTLFTYYFLRGLRWWMILHHLGHPTNKKTIIQSYFAQQITNFSSTLFLGGPFRIFLIFKIEHVPPDVGLVSLSREILSDLLALLVIIVFSLLLDFIFPYGFLEFVLDTLKAVINKLIEDKQLQIFLFLSGIVIISLFLLFSLIGTLKPSQLEMFLERIHKMWKVLKNYNLREAAIELILSMIMYFSLILHYEILLLGITDTEFNLLVSMASLSVFIFVITLVPIRIGVAEITLIGLSRMLGIPIGGAILVSIISRGIISLFALLGVPLATNMIKQGINQNG